MTRNPNSRLRHPLTRLHCLLLIFAALAVVVLADGVVSAAPRQQAMDDATLSSLSLSDGTLGALFSTPAPLTLHRHCGVPPLRKRR